MSYTPTFSEVDDTARLDDRRSLMTAPELQITLAGLGISSTRLAQLLQIPERKVRRYVAGERRVPPDLVDVLRKARFLTDGMVRSVQDRSAAGGEHVTYADDEALWTDRPSLAGWPLSWWQTVLARAGVYDARLVDPTEHPEYSSHSYSTRYRGRTVALVWDVDVQVWRRPGVWPFSVLVDAAPEIHRGTRSETFVAHGDEHLVDLIGPNVWERELGDQTALLADFGPDDDQSRRQLLVERMVEYVCAAADRSTSRARPATWQEAVDRGYDRILKIERGDDS